MKIVVIGGTGLTGSKLVKRLAARGHDVVPASPAKGINTLTGEGLPDALTGADVVVDVTNPKLFDENSIMEFFRTSGRNLLSAEAEAGVKHHVALSVVGTERLQESGYFRGKLAQEKLINSGNIPFTIVRATQFFEFMGGIADSGANGQKVHISPAMSQPISADDVADRFVEVAESKPINGTIEIAGPEPFRLSDIVNIFLRESQDPRKVVVDPKSTYFGVELNDQSLMPGRGALLGNAHFSDWMKRTIQVRGTIAW